MVQPIVLSGALHLMNSIQKYFPNTKVAEYRYFPDNELYLRFPFKIEDHVLIFQSMYGEPDKRLIETLFAIHTLKDLGAKDISAAITYLAYTRQDRRYKEGEAVSQLITLKMLRDAGLHRLLTFDAHFHAGMPSFEGLEIRNMKLAPRFKDFFKDLNDLSVVIGPDDDALELAKLLSIELGLEHGFIEKKRLGDKDVEMRSCSIDVAGKNVIIIDDMISTGTTIVEAIILLKSIGAKDIYIAATHGLFVSNSIEKITLLGVKKIVTSNSIPNPYAFLDLLPSIHEQVSKWSEQ